MLPNKISYKWNREGLVAGIPLLFGVIVGMIAIRLIVGVKPGSSFMEHWVPALVFSFLAITFLLFSACAFLLQRFLTIQKSHYSIGYSFLGLQLYRKQVTKSDYQLVYMPIIDFNAQEKGYGYSALATRLRSREVQSDDTGACWLISATDFNKRVKICPDIVVTNTRLGLPYKTNEAFLSAFFQLPCVSSYDDVAGVAGEGHTTNSACSQPSTLVFAEPPTAAGSRSANAEALTTNLPIDEKPKGTFKRVNNSDTVRLANHTGVYAGVTLFVLVVALMFFGAIPASGIFVIPVFIVIMLFRETITLTGEKIEACVGFPFLELERVSMRLDQVSRIRTYVTKAMGHEMVVLEILNDTNKAVRLPLGMTGGAGKTTGLSRLTMAEALWLSKKIKARLPASLKITVIEESLWD